MIKEIVDLKIVFFTNRSSHGCEILKSIIERGLRIQSIIIEVQGTEKVPKRICNSIKSRGLIETLKIILAEFIMNIGISSIQRREWHKIKFYNKFSDKIYTVKNFNSLECENLLKMLSPDIIVLGGSRILKKNIINIPRIGIINAHPGYLPKYRGVDVIPWAIYNGDNVGVTVHLIDENIDSGLIIDRQFISMEQGDTIDSLRKKTELLSGKMIADLLIKFDKEGKLDHIIEADGDGTVYHRMPKSLLKEARIRLMENAKWKK